MGAETENGEGGENETPGRVEALVGKARSVSSKISRKVRFLLCNLLLCGSGDGSVQVLKCLSPKRGLH